MSRAGTRLASSATWGGLCAVELLIRLSLPPAAAPGTGEARRARDAEFNRDGALGRIPKPAHPTYKTSAPDNNRELEEAI